MLARSLLNAVRSVKFSTYFTTYKQEPERPAAECDESGGVFGLAHIKKKIEEAVAEANGCDEPQRKLKVPSQKALLRLY